VARRPPDEHDQHEQPASPGSPNDAGGSGDLDRRSCVHEAEAEAETQAGRRLHRREGCRPAIRGIGASVSAFKNSNPTAANGPPASYQDGIAFYEIKDSVHGCVSEYAITESTTPTHCAWDLLFLGGGIDLPDDAHQLLDQNTCAAWSSGSLKKATGHLYAVGFVEVAPEGDATGIVDMSAGDSPKC